MGVFIKLLIIAVIILFLFIGVSSAMKLIMYYKVKRNGAFAVGTIVGSEGKGDFIMSLGSPLNYEPRKIYPVVEYMDESGMPVRAVYKGFVLKEKEQNIYPMGREVEIKYDPFNPENIIIIGDNNLHGNAWGFLIVSLLFSVIMAFVLFI